MMRTSYHGRLMHDSREERFLLSLHDFRSANRLLRSDDDPPFFFIDLLV